MDKMYARYKTDAEFLGVYIREAHPSDGWSMPSNDLAGITIAQPKTIAERVNVAARCSEALEVSMPLLVDHIDNSVEQIYSAFPDRLYLIDKEGKVAFKSGRGPFGFEPRELERSLVMLLLENQKNAPTADDPAEPADPEPKPKPSDDPAEPSETAPADTP